MLKLLGTKTRRIKLIGAKEDKIPAFVCPVIKILQMLSHKMLIRTCFYCV
jgi:hypothetical protein